MFQSTHSLWSATGALRIFLHPHLVSIHALLAECDLVPCQLRMHVRGFNPRTPCGVRPAQAHGTRSTKSFNPRTPCGVRPYPLRAVSRTFEFQSTHSLRSATIFSRALVEAYSVSIHALLAECDRGICLLPAGQCVSIHALLAECDNQNMRDPQQASSFNPRTPCGVRLLTRFR